jgi:signal transduction histidine kinase
VLKRFVRLDESRSKPGTGLGLSLVEAVMELHGGKLELSDTDPDGHDQSRPAVTLIFPVK